MTLDVRYANHPEDSRRYDTAELRRHYLIETVFALGEVKFAYSHQDRIIAGGVMPARISTRKRDAEQPVRSPRANEERGTS